MFGFNIAQEEQIDEIKLQKEAERRMQIERFHDLAPAFFEAFPPGNPDNYTQKMRSDQLAGLIRDYMGECAPEDVLGEAMREKGYQQLFDKDEHPVRVYWIFK